MHLQEAFPSFPLGRVRQHCAQVHRSSSRLNATAIRHVAALFSRVGYVGSCLLLPAGVELPLPRLDTAVKMPQMRGLCCSI